MTIHIYTDGACHPNPGFGGWGFHMIGSDGTITEKSGSEAPSTNNRMEMMSVIEALSSVEEGAEVVIYTDSQYVKNGITKWINGWIKNGFMTKEGNPVKNAELWMEMLDLSKSRRVTWKWVKGHANNAGNNRADELAVEARKKLAGEQGTPTAKMLKKRKEITPDMEKRARAIVMLRECKTKDDLVNMVASLL